MFKQEIGIPMGTDLAWYWANIFLHFFESKYVQQLISKESSRAYKFLGTWRFIYDLCTINDDGEFSSSHKYIYSKQLQIKLEHQGELATFLDLDITIKNNIFVYKLFDKRDKFLSSNIPSLIFYGSIFSEFLRIARCTLRLTNFEPKTSQFYTRKVTEGGNNASTFHRIKQSIPKIPWNIFKVL